MTSITRSLIDIDGIIYSVAVVQEQNGMSDREAKDLFLGTVRKRMREVESLAPTVKTHSLFVSGKKNFRKRLCTETIYKGGRPPKPLGYWPLYDVALANGACVDDFLEADDLTAMRHHRTAENNTYSTVLVDQDKDLDQVAGWRIIPSLTRKGAVVRKASLRFISKKSALESFYLQLLTGDTVDNIEGIYRVGEAKAKAILKGCNSEYELWDSVVNYYFKVYLREGICLSEILSKIISRCSLLYLKRGREDSFIPPFKRVGFETNTKGSA